MSGDEPDSKLFIGQKICIVLYLVGIIIKCTYPKHQGEPTWYSCARLYDKIVNTLRRMLTYKHTENISHAHNKHFVIIIHCIFCSNSLHFLNTSIRAPLRTQNMYSTYIGVCAFVTQTAQRLGSRHFHTLSRVQSNSKLVQTTTTFTNTSAMPEAIDDGMGRLCSICVTLIL